MQSKRFNYWATPTGEAQLKLRSFIGLRNGIPMGRLVCHWLHRDLFEICNLYGVLSFASTGNDVLPRHCTCFRSFHNLRGSLVRKINLYKVCMFKLSQLSKFLHGRRRKKLLSKFRTKSRVDTSIASRLYPTEVAALKLQQEVSHRFMFTNKTH